MSKCVPFLLPWTGELAQLFPGQGGLSVLLSLLPGSPGVKCFWAMQEGGLGEPPPPSQGPGVDLERERSVRGRAGRGGEGARVSAESQADWSHSGRRSSDHLCSREERYSREKVGASSLPGLGREAWFHLPTQSVAGQPACPAAAQLQLRLCESRWWSEKASQEPEQLHLKVKNC